MNANELAHNIELNNCLLGYKDRKDIATMLRQQQAEIEALKVKILTDTQIRKLYLYAFTDGELKYKRSNDAAFRRWAKEKMTEEL